MGSAASIGRGTGQPDRIPAARESGGNRRRSETSPAVAQVRERRPDDRPAVCCCRMHDERAGSPRDVADGIATGEAENANTGPFAPDLSTTGFRKVPFGFVAGRG